MQRRSQDNDVMTDRPALTAMNRRALLAAPASIVLPVAARAQSPWPARAVTIVEGYPPGGVTDITSRAVAERMAGELGQVVVVDNRPGAATSVAATSVARARNDGYTLLMGSVAFLRAGTDRLHVRTWRDGSGSTGFSKVIPSRGGSSPPR